MAYLVTNRMSFFLLQVPLWSCAEVSNWVRKIGFNDHASAFITCGVDGDILLTLDDSSLKNDIGITNGILRKRFIRELKALKKNADYGSKDKDSVMGDFLARHIGPEYRAYTYDLVSADLTLDLMKRSSDLDLQDLLKDAGVTSLIHIAKIIEAVRNLDDSYQPQYNMQSPAFNGEEVDSYDVFVSYPKHSGCTELASLIKVHLDHRGYSVYAEAHDTLSTDHKRALAHVARAKAFVIVLSGPDALKDCINDPATIDPVHKEIVAALNSENGCQIIPVLADGFCFPEADDVPSDMRNLVFFNGVKWVHDYQDACVDKLERFITGRGIISGRNTPLSRGVFDSGRSTPTKVSTTPLLNRKERHRTSSTCDSAISTSS